MSIKDKAKEALRQSLGECADPGAVVDELFAGASDLVCRNYLIRSEFKRRFASEPHTVNRVQEEIADSYGISRTAVSNIVLGG